MPPRDALTPGHEGQLMKVAPTAGRTGRVCYTNRTGPGIPADQTEIVVVGPGPGGSHMVRVRDVKTDAEYDLAHGDVDCGMLLFFHGAWHPQTEELMAQFKRAEELRAAHAKTAAQTVDREFPFSSDSGDYRFNARRRGKAVVILGDVIGPPGSDPYLVTEYAHRRELRVFRLAFRNNSAAIPFVGLKFEHIEADVPASVELLKIQLPNEETVEIRSRGRG